MRVVIADDAALLRLVAGRFKHEVAWVTVAPNGRIGSAWATTRARRSTR